MFFRRVGSAVFTDAVEDIESDLAWERSMAQLIANYDGTDACEITRGEVEVRYVHELLKRIEARWVDCDCSMCMGQE